MENVNVDFFDAASGEEIPVSFGDTTNSSGNFTVSITTGTFDLTYSPPAGSGAAGGVQKDVTITTATTLPTMILPAGWEISLTIVNFNATPQQDVVARFSDAAMQSTFTPRNTSDAAGQIVTVIPQAGGPYSFVLRDEGGRGFADKELIGLSPTANTDLGEIIVGPAQTFTGRTVRISNSQPVADVDIDMIDACGLELDLAGDLSDTTGSFSVSGLSDGRYELIFRPLGATGLARKEFRKVRVDAALNMGDVQLGVIRSVSGRAIDTGGAPVEGVDLNFTDQAYDLQSLLNNDNTLADGTFDIETTDGIYTVDFRPPTSSSLAPRTLFDISVFSDINLGDVVLGDAVTLSGTITQGTNIPVAQVDLDVFDPARGLKVFTFNEPSDALGQYSATMAPGTWDLVFKPPATRPDLPTKTISGYTITANQTLDVTLRVVANTQSWQLYW